MAQVVAAVAEAQVATLVTLSHASHKVPTPTKYPLLHVAHVVPTFVVQVAQLVAVQAIQSSPAVF